MAKRFLVADLLCGAGGSSTGAQQAFDELGLEMELVCLNHSPIAIGTHSLNHPKARHYCQDIAVARPHIIVPEGYLDLLLASPTCTHHSNARGGKPTSDQQRSDPWHIVTWFTELRVKRAIIENVWEFIKWGPIDRRTGRPVKGREGEYFRAWVETIKRLGATSIEYRKLNAADYGEATTRQRFIMMIRFDRRRIAWPVITHAKVAGDGLLRWRPAREIIDWNIKGRSIFGRKKPLVPKTLARIYDGAVTENWPEPFLVILRNHMAGKSIDGPLPTIAARGTHIGLAQPILIKQHFRRDVRSIEQPTPTATKVARIGLVEPIYVAEPFVLSQGAGGKPRPVGKPVPTMVRGGAIALVAPYYGSGSGQTAKPVSDPVPTIPTKERFGLVVPITHTGRRRSRPVKEPLATLTGANRGELALVEPVKPGRRQYDILYRMLEDHELAAAMGFDKDYKFTGNKTERIRQVGNAVSVRKMRACVRSMMADAAPAARSRTKWAEAAE